MSRAISVIGINGSPSRTGRCAGLLKKALTQSRTNGAKIQLIHLVQHERELFKLSHADRPPKAISNLMMKVQSANCLILATPVHWFGISALMKNFLDHLTNLESKNFQLEGIVVGFIATLEEDGGMKAVSDMAAPLNHMGAVIPPYAMFFHNNRVAKRSERKWMMKDYRLLGANVVKLARATKDHTWG